jgi:hypothetical protein
MKNRQQYRISIHVYFRDNRNTRDKVCPALKPLINLEPRCGFPNQQ